MNIYVDDEESTLIRLESQLKRAFGTGTSISRACGSNQPLSISKELNCE